jgi:hypothetical protein
MTVHRGPGAPGNESSIEGGFAFDDENEDDTVVELIHDLDEETATMAFCSECGAADVLAIVHVEPPPAYLLSGPTWWRQCVVAGTNRPEPTWRWCPNSQWYSVVGRFRIRIAGGSHADDPRPTSIDE